MRSALRTLALPILAVAPVLGCGDADPCDTLPSELVFVSAAACGHDTLTVAQLAKIEQGELSAQGLPYGGARVDPGDLPEIPIGTSKERRTRDVCRACQSVCDCWITTRACFDTAAVNKAMPKRIELSWTLSGIECGNNPGPPANHALACRSGQCVWEPVNQGSK